MALKEVRCPGRAPVGSKYDACGAFLGGLESGSALFRCPRCKTVVIATIEHEHITFSEPERNNSGKIEMKQTWRVKHEGR